MAFIMNRNEYDVWYEKHESQTPRAGESAPDFELGNTHGKSRVRLSDFAGKRSVALVFGSFT